MDWPNPNGGKGWSYPPKDYAKWAELVRQWVLHSVARYGKAEVEQWSWELWNEPDIFCWRGTPEEYNKLYDYTADAVKRALPTARVGGPGTTGAGSAKAAACTVRMNYFKTSEADTLALDAWIKRIKDASDRRQAPAYDVTRQNCATFCISGLIQSNAIQNKNISIVPNTLFDLLSRIATENYSDGQRTEVKSKICFTDENGKRVCQ